MVDRQISGAYSRHTDYSYIEEDNEQRTEQLSTKVNKLKDVVVQINDETKRQNEDLLKYQKLMDATNNFVEQAHRRIISLSQSGSWKIYMYLLLFSLFIFFIIYFIIK